MRRRIGTRRARRSGPPAWDSGWDGRPLPDGTVDRHSHLDDWPRELAAEVVDDGSFAGPVFRPMVSAYELHRWWARGWDESGSMGRHRLASVREPGLALWELGERAVSWASDVRWPDPVITAGMAATLSGVGPSR